MSDYGPPCVMCGHAATTHAAWHCAYHFGAGKPKCDCAGYAATVEVAQLRGFLPVADRVACEARCPDLLGTGADLVCARDVGHRGDHSVDREPGFASVKWWHSGASA